MGKGCKYVWLTILFTLLTIVPAGCDRISSDDAGSSVSDGPVTVAFGLERGNSGVIAIENGETTRTFILPDGKRAQWEDNDKILLWAKSGNGSFAISGTPFSVMANGNDEAIFTATLPQPMKEDTYTYYACYPQPVSISNTTAVFSLPAIKKGRAADGEDIMVSAPLTGGALKPYKSGDDTGIKIRMEHLLHLLRFYLPAGSNGLNGENIERIVARFPSNVAGNVTKDIARSSAPTLSNGVSEIEIIPETALAPSGQSSRNYACAAIFPTEFGQGAQMELVLYSDNWIGYVAPISISGRNFQSGHATDVCLRPSELVQQYALKLKLAANNLGEDVQKITISIDKAGCTLGEGGGQTYVWEPGGDIPLGEVLSFHYTREDDFIGLGGATISITYDSEHVICRQSIVLPNLKDKRSYTCDLTVPYLLFEDFSTVPSFSSNDEHKVSSTGTMSAYSFLNGWTGGRVGAQSGNCIRIAGRRECGLWIDAHYPARVDSAPLEEIKSPVDIEVSFDYGTNRDYTMSDVVKGQHIYVGYVTSTKAYASGDETGVFEGGSNNIDTEELTGSWTNLPNRATMVIHNIPAGTTNRITWRDDPYSENEFGANTTTWCYIDNIKVKVKQ